MRLLLDLGNSRLKWACASDASAAWQASGHADWGGDVPAQLAQAWAGLPVPQSVIGASVVDAGREALVAEASMARFGCAPRWLRTPTAACGVRNGYLEPQRLGVDRFLALVAAHSAGHAPCVVANAGTALTLDALDADGRHLGGWIIPGARAMRQAVAASTSRVLLGDEGTVMDLARSTEDAVASGCWHALAAAVERFVGCAAHALGTPPRLLLGGGDAVALAAWIDLPTQLLADGVLRGLAHWVAADASTPDVAPGPPAAGARAGQP